MILVTGATGFIGGHFLNKLHDIYSKEKVVLLSSKTHKNYQTIIYNEGILNEEVMEQLQQLSPQIVFHIGGYTPKATIEANDINGSFSNIAFTKNLLSCCKITTNFIFLSTLDVYENVAIAINEATSTLPVSLYGYSKLFCEKMVESWTKQNNAIIQVLRVGHVYGPGEEKYTKFLPVTLKKMLNNETLEIWGDGSDLRSFIHVEDVCDFILAAAKLTAYKGPVNLCGDESNSLLSIITKIAEAVNIEPAIIYKDRVGTVRHLLFDNAKRKQLLGEEKISFIQGAAEEYKYLAQL